MAVIPRSHRRFAFRTPARFVGGPLALVTAAVIALGITGCGSSAAPGIASAGGGPKPSATVITADEIAKVSVTNGYEVVQKLRPAMLSQRQVASAHGQGGVAADAPPIKGTAVESGQVVVYMDGTRLGGVEQLRQITASTIATLRYYSASEAQLKWGSNHPGGAIEVISKN
jgi:hypothetical protein